MVDERKRQAQDEAWVAFYTSGLANRGLRASDFVPPHTTLTVESEHWAEERKRLASILVPEAYTKLLKRFKTFKYRQKNNMTTLSVSSEILAKLNALAREVSIDPKKEGYSMVLECLLDGEHDYLNINNNVMEEIRQMPHTLSDFDYLMLRLENDIHPARQKMWIGQLVSVFRMGWNACQSTKGKKTTAVRERAEERFAKRAKYKFSDRHLWHEDDAL